MGNTAALHGETGTMTNSGFLAIWSDVPRERETDYLHWLTREHASERLAVDGFLRMSVHRAQRPDVCRYFIRYELASPDVLTSDAYLERLNAPTPWTQRIMPTLGNFARGGGRLVAEAGRGHGCVLAVIKLDFQTPVSTAGLVERIASSDRIVAARWLETDAVRTNIATREKSMRSGDGSFAGLVLIEGLDEAAVSTAAGAHGLGAPGDLYSHVFHL
jgi:hypothetical protein